MRNIPRLLVAVALLAPQSASAEWQFKLLEDAMTDAKRGISSLDGDKGTLVVKCDTNGKGSLYVTVISKSYLGGTSSNRYREMKFRVDGGEIQSISATHDSNIAGIFDVSPKSRGGQFLAQIATSSKLVVQLTGYDYDLHTIIFDTTGAADAIQRSAQTCGDTNWLGSV